jgi:hypothetical protein
MVKAYCCKDSYKKRYCKFDRKVEDFLEFGITNKSSKKEPPCTERYARWCERSEREGIPFLLLDSHAPVE